jgi:hypothetical protein
MAAQGDGAAAITASRDDDAPASSGGRRFDGATDRGGVEPDTVAAGAIIADIVNQRGTRHGRRGLQREEKSKAAEENEA